MKMRSILHIFGVVMFLQPLSGTVLADNKVVVVPLNSRLKPGTVIEGNINSSILEIKNNHTSGTQGGGISVTGSSPTAPAISGYHDGVGHALYGSSDSSYPTIGGINSGDGNAVDGRSTSGIGVYGYTGSINKSGVVGVQEGYSVTDYGSYFDPGGFFGGRNGVIGLTKTNSGYAVMGWDKSSSSGVAGQFISDNGWAGVFASSSGNGVYVSAQDVGLNVAGGSKNAVVATNDGARLMYTEESTQVWFSDYGSYRLTNGYAEVQLDDIFKQTVDLSKEYHVFVQPYGDASLYVTNRNSRGFEVHTSTGAPDIAFSYRIVALRKGHAEKRLERAPWADNDPHLYPEQEGVETDNRMIKQ